MAKFRTPPLKRHPALQPLSRDHYLELVQAQHLLKAADGTDIDRRAVVAAFLNTWEAQSMDHFDEEERLLVPLLAEPDAQRLRREHEQLRQFHEQALQKRREIDPDRDWVRAFGQTLNDHVRWEERELFPTIERQATPEQLEALKVETDRFEAQRRSR